MDGISSENILRRGNDTPGPTEKVVQLTRAELQRLMEEAIRNALTEHERRIATPIVQEVAKKQLFKERETYREVAREAPKRGNRGEPEKDLEADFSEIGSSEREKEKRQVPGISRAEVDNVRWKIE
ncbi:UNVERIFIED_CONTAM: hypothetical protein Sangu_2228000 [Sesamum angustifolium]|uniref:Uncharacterized protein n=1 Tax=Sesamum angustifolium TaxID=2727405 RepID=A0AAW2L6S0_9LAMI